MKKVTLKSLMLVGAVFGLIGCGSSSDNNVGNDNGNPPEGLPSTVQAAIDGPSSTIDQALTNTLAYMGNEERLAYDIYMNLYDFHDLNNYIQITQLMIIAQIA